MVKGIDVAQWQGEIDWRSVKNSGVQFAILKVINKSNKVEKSFERNYRECKNHGIPVGVYNYSYATNVLEAVEAAKAVVKVLAKRKVAYKVWLDVEDKCQQNIGHALIDIINYYQDVIEDAGYEFGVYTGLYFYNTYIKPYASEVNCDFWIARYPTSKCMTFYDMPNSAKKPSIRHNLWGWQYSSKGIVEGIVGDVDLDICYVEVKDNVVQSTTQYFPKFVGATGSIVFALNTLGIDSSYSYRKQIAKANGISNYVGSASQNVTMLNLLKKGRLERP